MKPIRLAVAQKVCRPLPPLLAQRLRHLIYPLDQAQGDDYEFIVRAQTGSLFKSRTSILQAWPFSVHGYYEWRNVVIAQVLCSPGDTIVEIGANIGTETICFADVVGRLGKVYAFEPLPSNLLALKDILSLNQHPNVVVCPAAVGAECKRVHFSVPPSRNNFGEGHILSEEESGNFESLEVECVALDSMADQIGPVKMIFMEAEGEEVMVLRGAREYIRTNKPGIVLEASPNLLMRAGCSLQDLYSEIKILGYEVFRIARLGLVSIASLELAKSPRNVNWLCVHSSKLGAAKIAQKQLRRCGLLPCIAGLNSLARLP